MRGLTQYGSYGFLSLILAMQLAMVDTSKKLDVKHGKSKVQRKARPQ